MVLTLSYVLKKSSELPVPGVTLGLSVPSPLSRTTILKRLVGCVPVVGLTPSGSWLVSSTSAHSNVYVAVPSSLNTLEHSPSLALRSRSTTLGSSSWAPRANVMAGMSTLAAWPSEAASFVPSFTTTVDPSPLMSSTSNLNSPAAMSRPVSVFLTLMDASVPVAAYEFANAHSMLVAPPLLLTLTGSPSALPSPP